MYQPPICKNDKCSKLVPPSKNSGVKRLFCDPRCARRYHARLQYQRQAGTRGGGLLFVNEKGQAQVNRVMPQAAKNAEIRYKGHLVACVLHEGPCPTRSDPYGRKKACLIGSTFADDWSQLKDAEEGKPGKRYATTRDGRWLADLTEEEKDAADRDGFGAERLTSAEREAALLAGAGKKEEFGTPSEALRHYNEGLPGAL